MELHWVTHDRDLVLVASDGRFIGLKFILNIVSLGRKTRTLESFGFFRMRVLNWFAKQKRNLIPSQCHPLAP